MGGYGIGFEAIVRGGGKKVPKLTDRHAAAALVPLWGEYIEWLQTLRAVAPPFVDDLLGYSEHVDDFPTYRETGSYRANGKEVEILFSGGGGVAQNLAECTAHMMTCFSDERWERVEAILQAAGLRATRQGNTDSIIREAKFFLHQGEVSVVIPFDSEGEPLFSETSEVLYVPERTTDLLVEMEGDSIRTSEMDARDRERVWRFWNSQRCECPACLVR